jgi:MFS transporter, DHA1 family, multidrug resistance protein
MQNTTSLNLSSQRIQLIVWTLLSFMPVIGMAVDLISPSLPAIASGLDIAESSAKNVISLYLLGYALGNFFAGFLTDAFGRQKLIRLNLLGFIAFSLIPIVLPQISFLLLARFLQGLTLGAVAVVIRAIVSDILPPEKLIRFGVLIGTMWGLGPVIGPILGGYLQFYFGWQAGFYFFALITFIGLTATFFIVPETHFNKHPLQLQTIQKNLSEVLRNRLFLAIVILMGLVYSLLIIFNIMGSFLIQSKFHYSAVFFGHLALYFGLVFLVATFVCRYLLKSHPVEKLFFIVINLSFLITLVLFAVSFLLTDSIVLLALASGLVFFICGFLFPMSMGKGMSLFRHIAGTASATMYLLNMLITSACGLLVSFINVQSIVPLICVYLLLLLGCVLIYWGIIRPATATALSPY